MAEPASRVSAFLDELAGQRRLSPHTVAAYRRDLVTLERLAAGQSLAALQAHQIRRFVLQLHASGLGGRSLGRLLSAWRGFYRWLARRGEVSADPCGGLKPPKSPKPLPDALSPDEAARLLDTAGPAPEKSSASPSAGVAETDGDPRLETRDQAIFELFYSSGLRLAELAGLDLDALPDLQSGEVRVTGKRSKTRIVPVGRAAVAAIDAWLAVRGELAAAGESALFVSRRGSRLSMRMIQSRLGRRARRAGLPQHVHPHMLRHSFASHVLQSSGDLRAVQDMLGHASIASTQVYTHLDFQHLAKVYDAAHPRAKKK